MNLNYPSEQTNETLISDMSVKPQVLNHEIVRNTNSTEDKHIMLTIGPEELDDSDSLFEINSPGGMQSRLMTSDIEFAIRAHLQELESHNVKEEKAIKSINNIDLNINIEDLDNQSQKDRVKHIVNTSKYLYNKYGVKSHVLFIKKGDWRNKNPSEEITKQAYDILDEEDRNTQACYQTAFLSCLALRSQTEINNDRISYYNYIKTTVKFIIIIMIN